MDEQFNQQYTVLDILNATFLYKTLWYTLHLNLSRKKLDVLKLPINKTSLDMNCLKNMCIMFFVMLLISGNEVLASRFLADATLPVVPELPKPELPPLPTLPNLPKPELPLPKVELPPIPHIPTLPKPELPSLPKPELPTVPQVAKPELPPLPKLPELPPLPHLPDLPKPTLPTIPSLPSIPVSSLPTPHSTSRP
jgi:hypothetical protein